MTDWPATLPAAPLADGFRETLPDNTLRSSVDQGPAKLRARGSAAVYSLSLGYILSHVETQTLQTFYKTTLGSGTGSFAFIHPRDKSVLNCRFRQPPALTALNGDYFRAAVELEVLP
ncbi:MAG: hypothetical protein PW788_02645 [Micavibrio sp.]|nr:hypothetical protein [Micavibrio sp.]